MRLWLFVLGAFAVIVCIASPASAQFASQSDRSISVHHRKNLRTSARQSDSRAFTSPPQKSAGTLGPGLAIQRGDRMWSLGEIWRRRG
jgi:hypothetical protein